MSLTDKTRYLNKGFSPHLREGWKKGKARDNKKMIDRAIEILKKMIHDAQEGKIPFTKKGQQAHTETDYKIMFFKEADEYPVPEPDKEIDWNIEIEKINKR